MSSFSTQLKAIAKKNALLKVRNVFGLLLEILVPVGVLIGLWGVRLAIKPTTSKLSIPMSYDNNAAIEDIYYNLPCGDFSLFYNCPNSGGVCSKTDFDGCEMKYVAIAPLNEDVAGVTSQFFEWIQASYNFDDEFPFIYFDSEQMLDDYIMSSAYSRDSSVQIIGAAVVLNTAAPSWSYSTRFNVTFAEDRGRNVPTADPPVNNQMMTNSDVSVDSDGDPLEDTYLDTYSRNGFLAIQDMVHSFITTTTCRSSGACGPTDVATIKTTGTVKFPNPSVTTSGFWGYFGSTFALVMILALLYPISNTIRALVYEKETKFREGMLMMSLRQDALWTSWLIHFLALYIPLAIIMMLVGQLVMVNSNTSYIFGYFMLYLLPSLSYAFLLSVVFSNSKAASIVGTLLYFMGYFIYIGLENSSPSRSQVILACLHPSAAFTFATMAIAEWENVNIGITDITWDKSETNVFTFKDTVTMQLINTAYLFVLGWYLLQVWPSEFGTHKPWHFLFHLDYWTSSFEGCASLFRAKKEYRNLKKVSEGSGGTVEMSTLDPSKYEEVSQALKLQEDDRTCVQIKNLRKEFQTNSGLKVAVDDLNLTVYAGQITALLGHNGAGKSTVLSMLSGLYPPTSGDATIEGHNISDNMEEARKSLGVCPQHDVLLDDLTVREHLSMFATIKGATPEEVEIEVNRMIESVGLVEKKDDFVKNLSGGQKRKLSVGIAFIGNSRVVILDEPTSGMDPYSRRFTWNVIRQHREGRVIILTTHFMDEADLLGDRIAIMGDGKLLCSGTSLFLKKMYGVGYNMVLEKTSVVNFDESKVMNLIFERIPNAKLMTNVGTELTVQLPFQSSTMFERLFMDLDDALDEVGIRSYGMSVTTLEEVFLKVASGSHAFVMKEKLKKDQNVESVPHIQSDDIRVASSQIALVPSADQKVIGHDLEKNVSNQIMCEKYNYDSESASVVYNQFVALIMKRAIIFTRDSKSILFLYGLPTIFLLMGMLVMMVTVIVAEQPKVKVSINDFNPGINKNFLPLPYANSSYFCPWDSDCDNGKQITRDQDKLMDNLPDRFDFPIKAGNTLYTIEDMSQYLYDHREDYQASTFGAYSFNTIDLQKSGEVGNASVSMFLHGNYTALHAGPVFSTLLAELYAKYYDPEVTIELIIHPFPLTTNEKTVFSNFNLSNLVIFILLAVPFISASFGGFVLYEREVKAKEQQLVSGVSIPMYWITTFTWDVLSYQITAWIFIILIIIFPKTDTISTGGPLGCMIIVFTLYGFAIAPFTYLQTFFFKKSSSGQISILFITFVLGMVLTVIGVVLRQINSSKAIYLGVLRHLFSLFPPFALGESLTNLAVRDYVSLLENGGIMIGPYDSRIAGHGIVYLAWTAGAYLVLVIIVDFFISDPNVQKIYNNVTTTIPDDNTLRDEDVIEEEKRVLTDNCKANSQVLLQDVKKVYSTGKYAVKGVSLGIPNGECFGLLGTNGAGKTSLLSILSGCNSVSGGSVSLGGLDFFKELHRCRQNIGYCPQFDALFDGLTAREHLRLYAQMKGVKPSSIESQVNSKIMEMGLTEYADRTSNGYSGGNKRKLSVALAMIGEPSLVFLDEPSTGMDPMARRFMWEVICDIVTKREKCSLILTTHSMEECEALCSRVGIMVGGVLRCLGSCQRLRSRYGLGYQIEILMEFPEADEIAAISENLVKSVKLPAGTGDVTESQMIEAFNALGHGDLLSRISLDGTGGDIRVSLNINKVVLVRQLSSWILTELVINTFLDFMKNTYPGFLLREVQGSKVRVEVPSLAQDGTPRKLSSLFGIMERNTKALKIREYSIAQTSLEQIFNFFASQQEEEDSNIIPTIAS